MKHCVLGLFLSCSLLAASCRRERRWFREGPEASALHSTPLQASRNDHQNLERYAKDAWAIGEGQRLFSQMNCSGCHGHGGGGGMAPPLMDSQWLYGSGLIDIERTILAGSAR